MKTLNHVYGKFILIILISIIGFSCGKTEAEVIAEVFVDSKIVRIGDSPGVKITYEDDLVVMMVNGEDTLHISYNSNDQIKQMRRVYVGGGTVFPHDLIFSYNANDELDEVVIDNINNAPESFDRFKYFHNGIGLIDSIITYRDGNVISATKYIYSNEGLILEEKRYRKIDNEIRGIDIFEYTDIDNPIYKNSNNFKQYMNLAFDFMRFVPHSLSQKKLVKKETRNSNLVTVRELEHIYQFNAQGQIEIMYFGEPGSIGPVLYYYYE